MILVDSNILIYIAQKALPESLWQTRAAKAYSAITKVEAIGYHKIPVDEMHRLNELFSSMERLSIDDSVINMAIELRQRRKIGLGDSVIAATALVHDYALWTANTDDFMDIEGLKLYKPRQ